MAIDLLQTATELHELQRQTRRILSQLHVVNSTNIRDINLLVAIRELCSSDVLNQRGISAKNIQVRSCIHHQVSEEGRAVLDRLERNSATRSALSSCPHNVARISSRINTADLAYSWDWITRWFRGANAVTPPTVYSNSPCTKDVPPNPTKKVASRIATQAKQSIILQETLQVLFTTECLILSEYLEIFVPAVYGVFVLAMVNFSNVHYHTELIGVTRENVGGIVSRIFLYVSMELASFVVLAVITQRNCGVNALYQLAFVLETQMLFVQSMLTMWILMTLTYRVTHFGKSSLQRL
ncbi:hypothetical protein AM588_10003446 [Phytophthora nicotianae]|nr:hypothetical protein AM588_10003446 [Phytophthora nicotianae]